MLVCKITLPLYVYTAKSKSKKSKVIMNLNTYRNNFFTKNNAAKKALKAHIKTLNLPISFGKGPFRLEYKYFHGNKRRIDLANPCSIIDKYVCDAFTEIGYWPDDNIEHVKEVKFKWGGVDPNKVGYCELRIYNI